MTEPVHRHTVGLDRILLAGEPRYSFGELAQQSGIDLVDLRGLWTAAGFAAVADDDRVFTDDDLRSVRDLAGLVSGGAVDAAAAVPGAQALGQAMFRLAELQAPLVRRTLDADPGSPHRERDVADLIDRIAALQTHIWRRHLVAATHRIMTDRDDSDTLTATMAVGFADMVGYTRLSRGLAAPELNILVTSFEQRMRSVILGRGGWIVKGVGDEVMFAADDPVAAAQIALELHASTESPELLEIGLDFPQLRVGLAYGDVLQRFGDLFGTVVNLASRLTSAARPTSVLIDDAMADALCDEDSLRTTSLRPFRARGFRAVHAHLLRRSR